MSIFKLKFSLPVVEKPTIKEYVEWATEEEQRRTQEGILQQLLEEFPDPFRGAYFTSHNYSYGYQEALKVIAKHLASGTFLCNKENK